MSAAALVSMNVCLRVLRVLRVAVCEGLPWGRVGPRVSGGSGQPAFVHRPSTVPTCCVAFLLCLCLLYVSSALLSQSSGYQGSVGLWHGPWSRMGCWVKGKRGSFPDLMPVAPWAFQKPVLTVLV